MPFVTSKFKKGKKAEKVESEEEEEIEEVCTRKNLFPKCNKVLVIEGNVDQTHLRQTKRCTNFMFIYI